LVIDSFQEALIMVSALAPISKIYYRRYFNLLKIG
jgi:hypothetical protein